ncbi:glutaredoxin 3 [Pseudorhizobium endolithicum]|uniref:Glutaredoxin n=2 Tax=Pseudorhizobium endolithicum TaxID=1191678 RepID=A0ABN7JK69_9HYPH|nr:glutaredoxin 3 [Pseudorhizobium endolithicum]
MRAEWQFNARFFPAQPRQEKFMADVTIYTRQGCGYCSRAKALLQSKGVDFIEHDATSSPDLRQEMIGKANGRSTFPQIFINGEHVGGCDDLHALDRAGKLDPMLAN